MNVLENELNCSICNCKVGLLTRVVNNTNHDLSLSIVCMDCLPKSLDNAEARKYNPQVIQHVRDWLLTEDSVIKSMEEFKKKYTPNSLEEEKKILSFLGKNPLWYKHMLKLAEEVQK